MSKLLLAIFLFNISTHPAYAYLDPGTGSYMLQLIIGGVLGFLFILKNYWRSLIHFFTKNRSKSTGTDNDQPAKEE